MASGNQQVAARHGLSKVEGNKGIVPTQMTAEVKNIKMRDMRVKLSSQAVANIPHFTRAETCSRKKKNRAE